MKSKDVIYKSVIAIALLSNSFSALSVESHQPDNQSSRSAYDYKNGTHYVDSVNYKNDWREMYKDWKYANAGHAQFISAGKHRSFNYYTTNENKMWFNYTFFEHRPDVWYEIYDAKKKAVIQSGWTTVSYMKAVNKQYGSQSFYELETKFDVDFRPETKMQPYVYVRAERHSLKNVTRGYVRDWPDATKRYSDFQILNSHKY